jgi:hypothetical protein
VPLTPFRSSRFQLLALLAFACVVALPGRSAAPTTTVDWRLDSTAKVGGHVATILGAPKIFTDKSGTAVVFNGASDGLLLDTNPIAGLTQFTIELRIRPDGDGQPEQRFFHIQDAHDSRLLFEIRLTPEKKWALDTFLFRDKDHQLPLLDRTKLHPADQWHWVALRYDGHQMASYVDGQPELSGDVSFGPMEPKAQTSLGVRLNKVFWFKGGISEVRIHPTALSPDQLAK